MATKEPAKNPCGSCPYRCNVPSGIWAPEEYAKLPEYDKPTPEQPPSLFLCHQQNGRVCAGWAGTHDMNENLALRLGSITGALDQDTTEALLDYETPVELFETGEAAARHGLSNVAAPTEDAEKAIGKLVRKKALSDQA